MKLIVTICFCFGTLFTIAQFKESFYALDKQWKQTDEKSAKYLLWIHLDSAGNWEYSYYHMWGPMIKLQTYQDHDGTILNGLSCYYYTTGNLDSVGHYKDGKKDGKFYKYAFLPHDTLRETMIYTYSNDSLLSTLNTGKDSAAIRNHKDSANEKKSKFPGGMYQWQHYLQHNLQYPDRAATHEIQGEVRTYFIIDEQGNVLDPIVSRSVEYSLDRESLRIIMNSGKWEPASENGRNVISYKTQPIVFRLEVSK